MGQEPDDQAVAVADPLDAVVGLVGDLENQLSIYREHTVVVAINRTAADQTIVVEPRLFTLLELCAWLHAVTRGMTSRPFTLGGVYVTVIVFGWPVLVMSMLGLADSAFDLRGRIARRRGPPNPQT